MRAAPFGDDPEAVVPRLIPAEHGLAAEVKQPDEAEQARGDHNRTQNQNQPRDRQLDEPQSGIGRAKGQGDGDGQMADGQRPEQDPVQGSSAMYRPITCHVSNTLQVHSHSTPMQASSQPGLRAMNV